LTVNDQGHFCAAFARGGCWRFAKKVRAIGKLQITVLDKQGAGIGVDKALASFEIQSEVVNHWIVFG
jgi:hypothetical protein